VRRGGGEGGHSASNGRQVRQAHRKTRPACTDVLTVKVGCGQSTVAGQCHTELVIITKGGLYCDTPPEHRGPLPALRIAKLTYNNLYYLNNDVKGWGRAAYNSSRREAQSKLLY
jgi:hypothetical protein